MQQNRINLVLGMGDFTELSPLVNITKKVMGSKGRQLNCLLLQNICFSFLYAFTNTSKRCKHFAKGGNTVLQIRRGNRDN